MDYSNLPLLNVLAERRNYPVKCWTTWQRLKETFNSFRNSMTNLLTFWRALTSTRVLNKIKKKTFH